PRDGGVSRKKSPRGPQLPPPGLSPHPAARPGARCLSRPAHRGEAIQLLLSSRSGEPAALAALHDVVPPPPRRRGDGGGGTVASRRARFFPFRERPLGSGLAGAPDRRGGRDL